MSEAVDAIEQVRSVFDERWDGTLLLDVDTGRELTYGDVLTLAIRANAWIEDQGFARGQSVPFAPANGLLPLPVYLSALFSGYVVNAIDPSRGEQDIDEMLDATSSERVLTDAESVEQRREAIHLPKFEAAPVPKEEALERLGQADPSRPFLTTFTSGTTGTPKGVVHSFENLVGTAIRFGERFGFDRTDTFYHTLPMGYMAGILNGLILPMVNRSRVGVGPRITARTASSFFDSAERVRANVFWFTPTMLAMLSRLCSGEYEGASEPIGCVATEPLPEGRREQFEAEFDITLYVTYGLSETLFITTEHPKDPSRGRGVGPTLDSVDLEVQPDGELHVKVSWLFKEYVNRESTPVVDGWFPTGDVGEIVDGTVVLTGRKKEIIVRNGVNLSPARIGEVVKECEGVVDAVVVGRPDGGVGERVVCAVVPEGGSFDSKHVQQQVIQRLGSDHRVDEFVEVPELPKIGESDPDRDALHELLDRR